VYLPYRRELLLIRFDRKTWLLTVTVACNLARNSLVRQLVLVYPLWIAKSVVFEPYLFSEAKASLT
jgi:hypothetical protein